MKNADRILPEAQERKVGDTVWMAPKERYGEKASMRVAILEPERAMVLVPPDDFETLASTGAMVHEVASQYADVPLAAYLSGAVVFLLVDRPLWAGVLAGLAAWTKDEGAMFCALLLVTIGSKDPTVRFQEFYTELARTGDGWKVIYWGPRGTNPPIPKSKT